MEGLIVCCTAIFIKTAIIGENIFLDMIVLVLWMGEGIDRSDHFDTQGSLYFIDYFSIRG